MYYKEFVSLRQAHDDRLMKTMQLEGRTSLLDSDGGGGATPQAFTSNNEEGGLAAAGGEQQQQQCEVAEAAEVVDDGNFESSRSEAAAASTDLGEASSGGKLQVLNRRRSVLSVRFSDGRLSESGSLTDEAAAQRRSSSSSVVGLGGQALQGGAPAHTSSDAGLRQRYGSQQQQYQLSIGGDSGSLGDGGGGSSDLRPVLAGHRLDSSVHVETPLGRNGDDNGAAPGVSGGGKGISGKVIEGGCKGVAAEWDELQQRLPLELSCADVARFYAVLVVDEAIEDFKYRWVSIVCAGWM